MTLQFDYQQAAAYVTALTGSPDTVCDFRAIHDRDPSVYGVNFRGTLAQVIPSIDYYNNREYGIFIVVNEADGSGVKDANIRSIRANFVDLDGPNTPQNWQRATQWEVPPAFAVVSSPGKGHIYWPVEPYADSAKFTELQRKLVTLFEGDRACVDPARVMRLPGTWHVKRDPASLVTFYPLTGRRVPVGVLEWPLAGVIVAAVAERKELGEGEAAPSLEWATYALNKIDPGTLDRAEWLKITAAFKSSAFQWGEPVARMIWDAWCATYPGNDIAENDKLWQSIQGTKTGWGYLARVSGAAIELKFGTAAQRAASPVVATQATPQQPVNAPMPPAPGAAAADTSHWMLTPDEQATYFAGCSFVASQGRMLTPSGRLMDTTKFNGTYGGKVFITAADGSKSTDEPWKAATRGQVFQVPKVDHLRFLPSAQPGAVILDEFGRKGVNTYKPALVRTQEGDPTPFLSHLSAILPTERDYRIIMSFLAHCAQRPGVKALWAPLIQSTPGVGKGLLKIVMEHAIGQVYVHSPNAAQLTESGAKFNAWLRAKLLIICDEIKVDEKRDMIEVLKPLITEDRIEIQGKGADQETEDNPANWIFFSNYKDAIPVDRNDRRFAVMYSTMQTVDDLNAAGMGGSYFPNLANWLRSGGGKEIMAGYLRSYPIEAEFDPQAGAHRAPTTSSTAEAIVESRGRIEQTIAEAVEAGAPGFRGGWLSSVMVAALLKTEGLKAGPHTLKRAFEAMGYHSIGRANRAYFQEDQKQPHIWCIRKNGTQQEYEIAQGYS